MYKMTQLVKSEFSKMSANTDFCKALKVLFLDRFDVINAQDLTNFNEFSD